MTTISLSVANIITDILALTAVRHHLDGRRPSVLTLDQSEALGRSIRAEAAEAFAAIPGIEPQLPFTDSDLITIEASTPRPFALLGAVTHIVTDRVLSKAYAGIDDSLSRTLAESARAASEIAAGLATTDAPCTITACRY